MATNAAKSNAVLICHALTGRPVVAYDHPHQPAKPGWWTTMIARKADRYRPLLCDLRPRSIGGEWG